MKKISIALVLMSAWIYYSSCSKNNDDIQNPDPGTIDSATIMGFKDSTLLIKSIHNIDYDGDGAFYDSATAFISYDTVNKKITITSVGVDGSDKQEFTYNSKGLLSELHETGDADNSADYRINYTYDESGILKSVKGTGGTDDDNFEISIDKTLLSSGDYQLEWDEPSVSYNPDTHEHYMAIFDGEGRALSYYDYANDKLSVSDSILYDVEGNISKVTRTLSKPTQDDPDAMVTITKYDFKSRDTKGDQLYNLYRIMYNGISNFSDMYSGIYGPFSANYFQVFKHPALATDISVPSGDSFSVVSVNDVPEYDSKNRLIKYNGFFDDGDIIYSTAYTISYYK
jgi:hypothetical protein